MKKMFFFISLVILTLFSSLGLCQDVITMVYRPAGKKPFIEEAPSNEGLYLAVFKEAATRVGMSFEIKRYPKKRAYRHLESGEADFYPGASFDLDREKIGYYIENYVALDGVALLYRDNINIKTLSEIKGYTLLHCFGSTTIFFDLIGVDVEANDLFSTPRLDLGKAIKMLQTERSDFYAYDLAAVDEYFKKNNVVGINKYPVYFKDQVGYLIFSKKSKYYKEVPNPNYDPSKELSIKNLPYTLSGKCIAYKFQQTLKSMHLSGEIDEIYRKILE